MGARLSRGARRALLGAALVAAGCARGAAPPQRAPATAVRAESLAVRPASAAEIVALTRAPGASATLVNVWASWCAPCREEMPALLAVARGHRAQGVRVALVSADFDSATARQYLARAGVDFPTYLKTGDDMAFIDALDRRWTGALPATFVYDARGALVRFWEGAADSQRFENAVAAALARGTAAR